MERIYLEFEQPIVELSTKINELKKLLEGGGNKKIDLVDEVKSLEEKLDLINKNIYQNLSPWQITQIARHQQRPRSLDYVNLIFDSFIELHGDRHFSDDKSIVCGIGKIAEHKIAFIGQQKGKTTKENLERNFGMQLPEGYRKSLRIMSLAEKFNLPLVTFVDTNGAYPGISAEERNQSEAIGFNLLRLSELKTPVICNIIGEGGSGGALAIAVGDKINMLQYAIYSVITPEGCASILWKDAKKASDAAAILGITAQKILELKLIDQIIPEPTGGAHTNYDLAANLLKNTVVQQINKLKEYSTDELLDARIKKIMNYGVFNPGI